MMPRIRADENPACSIRLRPAIVHPRGVVTRSISCSAPWKQTKRANSENHEKDGQNVLYGDGHVDWQQTALCGANGDNIYINKKTPSEIEGSPVDKDDSVLLPADD